MIDTRPGAKLPGMMQDLDDRLEELSYSVPNNTAEENAKAFKELGDKHFPKIEKLMDEIRNEN